MMTTATRAFALTLLLIGAFCLPASALDGCPKGEFTLEGGCVLCLPGYTPQKTGNKNPQGHDCYACLPRASAPAQDQEQVCPSYRPSSPDEASSPAPLFPFSP